jgi:hypothetical protein
MTEFLNLNLGKMNDMNNRDIDFCKLVLRYLKESNTYTFQCIEKINGLDVFVIICQYITQSKEYHVFLDIRSKNIFYDNDTSCETIRLYSEEMIKIQEYDIGVIHKIIVKIFDTIRNLTFSKPTGRFIKNNSSIIPILNIDYDYVSSLNLPNVTLNIHECFLCKELTKTKTPCNHSLCIECWSNLNVAEEPLCPLCNKDILYFDNCDCDNK